MFKTYTHCTFISYYHIIRKKMKIIKIAFKSKSKKQNKKLKTKQKRKCVCRESNPGLLLGRQLS